MKVLGTRARPFPVGRKQTQVGTTSVVFARIGLVQRFLSRTVEHLQVHGTVDHLRDVGSLSAVVFVSFHDRLGKNGC